ncbi:hypothetical protein O181_104734 [Austropuccinia psidii MF-1]|uniref:Uncharacterized protein n=1 Tax=Austropuccinia psidii MF-1 TaxID=1389203 RepID=A0A9Q3JN05_9BASI|nr:hypothetical protein [Austropuccinia psidii MF-1]
MENGQQMVEPSITLGRAWSMFPEDMSQRNILQRPYGNNQKMESHQSVQNPGGEGNQDKGESSHYPTYRRNAEPDRAHSDSFKVRRSRQTQLSSGFKPFRHQQISGQESPFLKYVSMKLLLILLLLNSTMTVLMKYNNKNYYDKN